ncbi:MAG TPA: helix-turn-helix domain-containing protein [Solirubrobacterales bacterium]|nr:helix-turn-helix domain-containing protein [Solirubrobacterales bacterium]
MDLPLSSDDALGQPTRAQIFTYLVERRAPAGTEEVAEHFGLHPNGVRRHLERLEEGGFVDRTRERGSAGRPRDIWAISPAAHPGGLRPRAYAELASWLARAIPANASRLREVERTGEEIGAELAPAGSGEPIEDLRSAITALGFQPELEIRDGGFTCTLGNCPYRDSVQQNQEVVCTLHRGITKGLLAAVAPTAKLEGFEPRDPEQAGCLVTVDTAGG